MTTSTLALGNAAVSLHVDRSGRRRLWDALLSSPYCHRMWPSGPIEQAFTFASESMPGEIHWPRSLQTTQDGKPYFELTFAQFEVSTRR